MRTASILAASVLLVGCATITRGTTEVLIVESEPSGADVDIAPIAVKCVTPCGLIVKRKHNYFLDIRKDGYEPMKVNILSEISGSGAAGMAGNVLLGGLVGAAIDAGTGATKRLKPNPVMVKLIPLREVQ